VLGSGDLLQETSVGAWSGAWGAVFEAAERPVSGEKRRLGRVIGGDAVDDVASKLSLI
jgi:hypothetical protein